MFSMQNSKNISLSGSKDTMSSSSLMMSQLSTVQNLQNENNELYEKIEQALKQREILDAENQSLQERLQEIRNRTSQMSALEQEYSTLIMIDTYNKC